MNDLVMEIIHDPGRGALLVKVVFRDTDKLKLGNVLLMTVGGTQPTRANLCSVEPRLSEPSTANNKSTLRGTKLSMLLPSLKNPKLFFLGVFLLFSPS